MSKRQRLSEVPEEIEGVDEWSEYYKRRASKECTCDLLEPYGHVTCVACNKWDFDDEGFLEILGYE